LPLTVTNVTKTFGLKTAVDDLSFEILAPGVFGLLGTNGAGKTTTFRMILNIMRPDRGEILWNGKAVSHARSGYMPEERGIYAKIKVLDQLAYFGELRGMGHSAALDAAKRWLTRLGITEYTNSLAEKLSKGNQQKVQLIAALIHDPELIFLDEPFSGLDPINTDVFKGVIAELVERDCTIVFSAHQMATVEEYCQDILILNRGKTVLQGNLREIKAGYGHTNLSLICAPSSMDRALALAEAQGLKLLERQAELCEFTIDGDAMAQGFLRALMDADIFPERFEIREPSLHEIFIEKVGASNA
jgi:ABC-2 type transport system ATP-binding protein